MQQTRRAWCPWRSSPNGHPRIRRFSTSCGIISTERNIISNLVGTYNDLAELMVLVAQGKVTLHRTDYDLEAVNDAMDDLDGAQLRGRGILIPAIRS